MYQGKRQQVDKDVTRGSHGSRRPPPPPLEREKTFVALPTVLSINNSKMPLCRFHNHLILLLLNLHQVIIRSYSLGDLRNCYLSVGIFVKEASIFQMEVSSQANFYIKNFYLGPFLRSRVKKLVFRTIFIYLIAMMKEDRITDSNRISNESNEFITQKLSNGQ